MFVTTMDVDAVEIDFSVAFNVDATNYAPHTVAEDNVVYTPTINTVQVDTKHKVEINSPVPFDLDGCYVKFNFPDELLVSTSLTTFTGAGQMLDPTGGSNISPVASDLTSATGKYVILKGCHNANLIFA